MWLYENIYKFAWFIAYCGFSMFLRNSRIQEKGFAYWHSESGPNFKNQ